MSKTKKTKDTEPLTTITAADIARAVDIFKLFVRKGESWQKSWEEEFTFRCYRSYTKTVNHYKYDKVWQQWRTCFINEVQCSCIEKTFFSAPMYILEMYLGDTARKLENFAHAHGFRYWDWIHASFTAGEEGKWTAHAHVKYTREKEDGNEYIYAVVDRVYWVDAQGVEHTTAQLFSPDELEEAKKETKTVKGAIAKLAPWAVDYHRHGDTYFCYDYENKKHG